MMYRSQKIKYGWSLRLPLYRGNVWRYVRYESSLAIRGPTDYDKTKSTYMRFTGFTARPRALCEQAVLAPTASSLFLRQGQFERHAVPPAIVVRSLPSNDDAIIYAGDGRRRVTGSIKLWLDSPLDALPAVVRICRGRAGNDRVRTTADVWTKLKAVIASDVAAVGVTPAQTDALSHAIRHVLQTAGRN